MKNKTRTKIGAEARKSILRGVNAVYDPVRMTLGPSGQNALLFRTFNRGSRVTNDGVTVAKVIEPQDEFENLAAHTFRESAEKTNQLVGDGTTSTIVISGHLINRIFNKLAESSSFINTSEVNVMQMRKEIQENAKKVIEKIKERSKNIESLEDLEKIAIVSVEDEEIGKIIAKAVWDVGIDGFVEVTESGKWETEVEITNGMKFPARISARAFLTHPERYESVLENIPVVVTNFRIENPTQLKFCNTKNIASRQIAIFAPEFSDTVLIELVKAIQQNFTVFPIKVPSLRTEQLEDLAVFTGATFINKDKGMSLDRITVAELGNAEKIIVKDSDSREDAFVRGGKGEIDRDVKMEGVDMKVHSAIHDRIEMLKKQRDEAKIDLHKKDFDKRIASLSSKIGVIRVGGSSDADVLYKKLKMEDAVYACKAALEEGYVKGGGLCLKEISEELPESIITESLKSPYNQIQENNGGVLDIGDEIVDPTKVVRLEVEHAMSVASTMITTGIIIPELDEPIPGQGEEKIARVMSTMVKLWNKKEKIWKENELEMQLDEEIRNREIIENDNG